MFTDLEKLISRSKVELRAFELEELKIILKLHHNRKLSRTFALVKFHNYADSKHLSLFHVPRQFSR